MKRLLSLVIAAVFVAGLTFGCDQGQQQKPAPPRGAVQEPENPVDEETPAATPAASAPAPAASPAVSSQSSSPAAQVAQPVAGAPEFNPGAKASGMKYACPNGHDTYSNDPNEMCGDCQTKLVAIQ